MHRSDCIKVVAFTVNVLKAAPTATPESVCRMLSATAEIARLDKLDAEHGLTAPQRASLVRLRAVASNTAAEWNGYVLYAGKRSPVTLKLLDVRAFAVPVIY